MECFILLGIKDYLGKTIPITQVDEDKAAVIPPDINKAGETNILSHMGSV